MNIKELRTRKGLTQIQLSEQSGVSQQLISAIESGKVKNPTWQTVEQLKSVLGDDLTGKKKKVDRKKEIESIRDLF